MLTNLCTISKVPRTGRIRVWLLSLIWARRMIGSSGISSNQSCVKWVSWIIGSHWLWSVFDPLNMSLNIIWLSPMNSCRNVVCVRGDPLSPYLFLFSIEAFSRLLCDAQADCSVCGIRANQNGPRINHFFFADDALLFVRNKEKEIDTVLEILRLFEDASG